MSIDLSLPVAVDARLTALIRELAGYGLGAFRPHMHLPSGEMVALPAGQMVIERGLRTSVVQRVSGPPEAVPVGWRWNGTGVEVFALCCDRDDEFNPPAREPEIQARRAG